MSFELGVQHMMEKLAVKAEVNDELIDAARAQTPEPSPEHVISSLPKPVAFMKHVEDSYGKLPDKVLERALGSWTIDQLGQHLAKKVLQGTASKLAADWGLKSGKEIKELLSEAAKRLATRGSAGAAAGTAASLGTVEAARRLTGAKMSKKQRDEGRKAIAGYGAVTGGVIGATQMGRSMRRAGVMGAAIPAGAITALGLALKASERRRQREKKAQFSNPFERQQRHKAYMANRFRHIQRSRMYRMAHRAQIARKKKKYSRRVKMKAHRPKKRMGSAGGGYFFMAR